MPRAPHWGGAVGGERWPPALPFRPAGAGLAGGPARWRGWRGGQSPASWRSRLGAQASGGVDSLLSRPTIAGLAANDDEGSTLDSCRVEAKPGYGFAVFGNRFLATPEIGLGLSDTAREYSLG